MNFVANVLKYLVKQPRRLKMSATRFLKKDEISRKLYNLEHALLKLTRDTYKSCLTNIGSLDLPREIVASHFLTLDDVLYGETNTLVNICWYSCMPLLNGYLNIAPLYHLYQPKVSITWVDGKYVVAVHLQKSHAVRFRGAALCRQTPPFDPVRMSQ